MKKVILFGVLGILLSACAATVDIKDNILKCNCSTYLPSVLTVDCNGTICQSDTCQTYFKVWKELFLTRNQMTESYFNNHITPCTTSVDKWNDGISFGISYKVKMDWAETKLYDTFVIWLAPSTANMYPSISLPRGVLLTKDQINTTIDKFAFNPQMFSVASVTGLKYASRQEAMKALIKASKVDTLCAGAILFQAPHMNIFSNGNPLLQASAIINYNENKCITCTMDLVTGDVSVAYNVCYINFCFTKGTVVTLPDGQTKPIETLKKGDAVLSVNLKTMKPEKDIVLHIDSVLHKELVRIVFSDLTQNINTSDHPYFVEGKGWCSCKPIETTQKYNIETKQLKEGDVCLKYQHNKLIKVQVKKITKESGEAKTYNISRLRKNNNYFANGILVSDEKR